MNFMLMFISEKHLSCLGLSRFENPFFFPVMTESSTGGAGDNLNVYTKPKSLLDVPGSVKLGGLGGASEVEEMSLEFIAHSSSQSREETLVCVLWQR